MKYLTVTPFKEFGKFPKMSGDHRFSSAIALPRSQVKQQPNPRQKADDKRIHITPRTVS